jgi:hypothetical protein
MYRRQRRHLYYGGQILHIYRTVMVPVLTFPELEIIPVLAFWLDYRNLALFFFKISVEKKFLKPQKKPLMSYFFYQFRYRTV